MKLLVQRKEKKMFIQFPQTHGHKIDLHFNQSKLFNVQKKSECSEYEF